MAGQPAEVVEALAGWLAAAEPPPLIVETSGSSGIPKRVVLPREAVLASARATARRLGGEGRWALALPPTYVAGIQVVVRSLLAGQPPVVDGWGDADYTSLVPTQLHRLLESEADVAALAAMRAVLLGGGPIDPALRRRAEAAGVRVVATYGMAETSGGCVYDGHPLDGVGLAIGKGGRIRISGPMLFERYDGDPAATEAALVDGWFLTSDAGRLDEDGRLHVLGRLDDVVVSGGVNVPTPTVAARLREHPAVEDAAVVGVPDEEWGERVVAYVVGGLSREEVRAWVAEVHPRSWAPREVVTVDHLPLLPNGKLDRQALRDRP
ncbi:AMP-binding protein [Nocardioides coralli]|nr:AMP-binding protein [Nocardioides coralli]